MSAFELLNILLLVALNIQVGLIIVRTAAKKG